MSNYPLGIRLQPKLILLKPRLEFFAVECLLPFLGEDFLHIRRLHPPHSLVIAVTQGIQFPALALESCHLGLTSQCTECFQIEIVRMQGKGRNDIIRIGVMPTAVGGGIIHWQRLDYLHPRCHSPIHEPPEVTEVAHATGVLTTQTEYRHHYACRSPCLFLHPQTLAIHHQHRTVWHCCQVGTQQPLGGTVVALFPGH